MTSDEYQDRLAHLLACGVPELEAETVAKGPQATPAALAVREWLPTGKTFCMLIGGAGSGKTVAAAEALLSSKVAWDGGKAWAYSPSEAKFIVASDLARLSYFDAGALRTLGRVERVPWLVLDDLGGELLTDGWKSNLTDIVLRRNSGRHRTIITTNLPVEEFKARYDERVVSRLRGNGVVVATGNADLRRAP